MHSPCLPWKLGRATRPPRGDYPRWRRSTQTGCPPPDQQWSRPRCA
jgi:hypothetical protein